MKKPKIHGRQGTYDGMGKTPLAKPALKPQQKPLNVCPYGTRGAGRIDANGAIVRTTGPDPTGGVTKSKKTVNTTNMSVGKNK